VVTTQERIERQIGGLTTRADEKEKNDRVQKTLPRTGKEEKKTRFLGGGTSDVRLPRTDGHEVRIVREECDSIVTTEGSGGKEMLRRLVSPWGERDRKAQGEERQHCRSLNYKTEKTL